MEKSFNELYHNILEKLDSEIVELDGNTLNLYDVKVALKNEVLFDYQTILKNLMRIKKTFDKCYSRLDSNYFPIKVDSIVQGIIFNGNSTVNISKENNCSLEITKSLENIEYHLELSNLPGYYTENMPIIIDAYNKEKSRIIKVFDAMDRFPQKCNGIDHTWSTHSKDEYANFSYNDGFLTYNFDLTNLSLVNISFADTNNLQLALVKSKNGTLLYDYIEFYEDAILKRTAININDLNPLYKAIVKNYYNIKDTKKLQK